MFDYIAVASPLFKVSNSSLKLGQYSFINEFGHKGKINNPDINIFGCLET